MATEDAQMQMGAEAPVEQQQQPQAQASEESAVHDFLCVSPPARARLGPLDFLCRLMPSVALCRGSAEPRRPPLTVLQRPFVRGKQSARGPLHVLAPRR